jgi:hypothetical protein
MVAGEDAGLRGHNKRQRARHHRQRKAKGSQQQISTILSAGLGILIASPSGLL